jgi:hypothetical protein
MHVYVMCFGIKHPVKRGCLQPPLAYHMCVCMHACMHVCVCVCVCFGVKHPLTAVDRIFCMCACVRVYICMYACMSFGNFWLHKTPSDTRMDIG